MTILQILILILIGLITGLLTGLTGASGVILVVPCLNILSNYTIHESIGTSLMVNVITALAISYVYFKHKNIDFGSGLWIAVGSILGSQLGTKYASGVKAANLGTAFGIFMLIMGAFIWRKGIKTDSITKQPKSLLKFKNSIQKSIVTLILGFFVGIMTGIFGAGGGGMILIILIFILNYPLLLAIGTSSFLMTITALSGAIGYAMHGNVRWVSGLIIGLSSVISGIASAKFANKVNDKILSKAMGAIFIFLGAVMFVVQNI
ncbi:MAG TPA: hypothetical protein DCX03_07445 [Bacteroidales bacterium]|nr:hypothetical protein [Bacteroidales bacterium]